MAEIRAGVLLSLKDQFSPGMKKAGAEASAFGSGLTAACDKINKATSGVAAKLGGLGLSFGLGVAIKGVIDYQARLVRLATAADMSDAQLASLKKTIYDIATAPDIKVDPSQITSAIEEILERTGDLQFATDNVRTLGLTIQATGAEGGVIGGLAAEFNKLGFSSQELMSTLDILNKQGKAGAFTSVNFAAQGPRLLSSYAGVRKLNVEAVRELNATMQIIQMGAGSAEQATTSFEAVIRNLSDPKKAADLKKMGINVRDVVTGEFRPASDVLMEIASRGKTDFAGMGISVQDAAGKFKPMSKIMDELRAKGGKLANLDKFGTILDSEGMRTVNAFQVYGDKFKALAQVTGDGSSLFADGVRNASTLKASLLTLQSSFSKFADTNLTAPLGKVADFLNSLERDPEKVQAYFKAVALGLGAIVAVKGLATVVGLVSNLKGLKGGKGGALGLAGGLAGGMGTPVMVTNWPMGFGAGLGGGPGFDVSPPALNALKGVKGLSRGGLALGAAKSVLGKAGLIGAGLVAVGGTVATLANKDLSREDKFKGVGESVGTGGGGLVGAAIGAAIGTALLPGVGTILGGLLGGAIGSWAGGQGGRAVGGLIADANLRGPDKGTASGLRIDPLTRQTLGTIDPLTRQALATSALTGAAQAPKGEVRILAETRITDERTISNVSSSGSTVPGWTVNTGRAQEARGLP